MTTSFQKRARTLPVDRIESSENAPRHYQARVTCAALGFRDEIHSSTGGLSVGVVVFVSYTARHMYTRSRKKLTVIVALTSLAAVMFGGGYFAEAKRGRKAPEASSGSDDCKKDTDCALVPDDCCPCSAGGKQHAIPKKQKDAYEKARTKRCKDTACAETMSQDPSCTQRAFCGAGICELENPPGDAKP
jgi:hypothetical protein